MPSYYKEIFSKIEDNNKYKPELLKFILKEVYTSRFEQYKLIKSIPQIYKQNEEIKKTILENSILSTEQITTIKE